MEGVRPLVVYLCSARASREVTGCHSPKQGRRVRAHGHADLRRRCSRWSMWARGEYETDARTLRRHVKGNHHLPHTLSLTLHHLVVNVEVEDNPRRHIIAGICTAAEARCSRCMLHLGWKFVRVPDEDFVFQAGRFLLYLVNVHVDDDPTRYKWRALARWLMLAVTDAGQFCVGNFAGHNHLSHPWTIPTVSTFTSSSAVNAEPTLPSPKTSFSCVNVHVGDDPMDYRTLGDCTIADAYCHRCKMQLGWMFAGVPEFVQVGVLDFNIIVRVGNVLLYPCKAPVLGWKPDFVCIYPSTLLKILAEKVSVTADGEVLYMCRQIHPIPFYC
ncbi:hypothetical protein Acr_26g0012620 [Actinidia rufa]|uniref:Yippee domain-containing protein n=1 Tax=Actinidia rufa TaxID=165716 RepID=A0A7J0H4G2_9ERIC|nr:hypothetical protein Acr_26g0012620 [Actinidia rufa]